MTAGQGGASRKQALRELVRGKWNLMLDEVLPIALGIAQERENAAKVADEVWADPSADRLRSLDEKDKSSLLRDGGCPEPFWGVLASGLVERAAALPMGDALSKYATRSRLLETVRGDVEHKRDDIRRRVDAYFEDRGTDRLASASGVRNAVLLDLNRRCYDACATSGGSPSVHIVHRLKILTVLTHPTEDRLWRSKAIARVTDHTTASFPYVVRDLVQGVVPVHRAPPRAANVAIEPLPPGLLSRCPEVGVVNAALLRFRAGHGLLERVLNAADSVHADCSEDFDRLPADITDPVTGVLQPKASLLKQHRQARYSLPDGIVCALGLCIVAEWVVRQLAHESGMPTAVTKDLERLASDLHAGGRLTSTTRASVEAIFGGPDLAMRDGVSHGAFVAGDPQRVAELVADLSRRVKEIAAELERTPGPAVATRWDVARIPSSAAVTVVKNDALPGVSLIDHFRDDSFRKHFFDVLSRLTPDKASLGQASTLLWMREAGRRASKQRWDADEAYTAALGSLVCLEDLWRAVLEVRGYGTVVARPVAGLVRCELRMLTDKDDNLLSPAALTALFDGVGPDAAFMKCALAVKELRDLLFHGSLACLGSDLFAFGHAALKVMLAVTCEIDA